MHHSEFLKQFGFKQTENFVDDVKNEHITDYWKDGKRVLIINNLDKTRVSIYNGHIFHKIIAETEQEIMNFLKENLIV